MSDMSAPELKPCPFCGKNANLFEDHDNAWITCDDCQISLEGYETCSEAISAWNTRAALNTGDDNGK